MLLPEHDLKTTPTHPDSCDHPPETFLGSVKMTYFLVEVTDKDGGKRVLRRMHPELHDVYTNPEYVECDTQDVEHEWWDVYVFPTKYEGMSVCLRCGPEGPDYMSPGSLSNFIRKADPLANEGYSRCLELILLKGHVVWQRK